MAAGVTLVDPDSTYIDPGVEIGADTIIGPHVHLLGKTVVGANCRFDGNAFVTDTTIADGVHVKFSVVMTRANVGSGCLIGPFAQLRPDTRLAHDVHIGDFVETKNAVIGARTKANHLAYLGDVEIGQDSNIGAGTITCNYDGFGKHQTVIGDRVQVGSDSQLIAPVKVADDSYIATGTSVRKDAGWSLVFAKMSASTGGLRPRALHAQPSSGY
jgi:bifunctional UDP-N-acetylglucosamine pyrophosphorylase/glucosamine-1-phosphate N-acetyltransferase